MRCMREQQLGNEEMKKDERGKFGKRIATGMGIAAVAGVAAGLLIAQKTEDETLEGFKGKAECKAAELGDSLKKRAKTVRCSMNHATQEACEAAGNTCMKAEGVKDEIDSCCNDLTQGVHRAVDNISYGHSRLHPLKKGKRMIGKLLKRFVWTAEKVLAKTFPEE